MKTKTIISTILGLSLLYGLLPAQENDVHKDWLMPLPMLNATVQNQVIQYPPKPGMADTQYWNYIPYDNLVNLEVNVNLVFIQKDNGSGNFQEDDPEHRRFWDEITAGINNLYAAFKDSEKDSCFAWRDKFISDSKIRFKFNRYYMKRSSLWDWTKYGSNAMDIRWALDAWKAEMENDPSIPKGISVFFTENGNLFDEYMDIIVAGGTSPAKDANFAYSSFPGKNMIARICMPDTYCKFLWMKHILPRNYAAEGQTITWDNTIWHWEVGTIVILLAHELGHALDLNHDNNHYGQKIIAGMR